MKRRIKKLQPAIVNGLGYLALGSLIILGDQIRRIYNKINRATSTDVLSIDRFQPTFIYIEDPYLQEEIAAGEIMSRERLKLTRFHKLLYDKIEESFVFRNWFSYKKNLAWRYLRLAKDECQSYRVRAVRSLANLTNLTDSDYQQLAQACDMRTAMALARSSDNVKFLLDPPFFKQKPVKKAIIKSFQDFFLGLQSEGKHSCLQYFVTKVITDITDADSKGFDDDIIFKVENSRFIPMCLEALLHHSRTDHNAKQIVNLGGLPLLVEVYKYLMDPESDIDIDSIIHLSRLISNLTSSCDNLEVFFTTGWVKLLAILAQHKDIRISAPAQKALLNLDRDDPAQNGDLKYSRRIYPLHPIKRTLAQPKLDVVFIHGLLGGIFITWRQRDSSQCSHKSPLELLGITVEEDKDSSYQISKSFDQEYFMDVRDMTNWDNIADSYEFVLADVPVDSNFNSSGPFYGSANEDDCGDGSFTKCWPKDWLAKDCPEIRLIGVDYETNISKWTPLCPIAPTSGSLRDRSIHLLHNLSKAGVGRRPIVWIGHSMGGLIVKGLLSLASSSPDPMINSLFKQTKAIVFYSTPHKGSHLAAFNPTSQMILWPSVEVQELRQNSPILLQLHQEFLELYKENPIKVISFAERESTYITSLKFKIRFVDAMSADPDVGEIYGIPLDHLCICKPAGKQSFLYQKVKKLILEIISEEEMKGS